MPSTVLVPMVLVAVLALAGCGSSDGGGSASAVTKDSTGTPTVDITFKGDTVKPHGVEVKVTRGKPLTLHITADKGGELHVHSEPEQEIRYAAGTTDETITLDQPGVVEVESHDLDTLVLQLQVR